MRKHEHGAVLILVLVVLALLAVLGAASSRRAMQRRDMSLRYRQIVLPPTQDLAGGMTVSRRANIDDGANRAPSL